MKSSRRVASISQEKIVSRT